MRHKVVRFEGEYGTWGSMSSHSSGGREVAVAVGMVETVLVCCKEERTELDVGLRESMVYSIKREE